MTKKKEESVITLKLLLKLLTLIIWDTKYTTVTSTLRLFVDVLIFFFQM